MVNNVNVNNVNNNLSYLDNMTKEELEELYDEIMGTLERHPKRVRKVVKKLPVLVSER